MVWSPSKTLNRYSIGKVTATILFIKEVVKVAHHLRLVFYGYTEVRQSSMLHVVKYVLGKRDPRVLPFSRWCQVAPSYNWGVWSDEEQPGCYQLAWTILFAYLVKQTDLTDNKTSASLITETLATRFAKQHVSRLPETWYMSSKTIAKFLSKSSNLIPSP